MENRYTNFFSDLSKRSIKNTEIDNRAIQLYEKNFYIEAFLLKTQQLENDLKELLLTQELFVEQIMMFNYDLYHINVLENWKKENNFNNLINHFKPVSILYENLDEIRKFRNKITHNLSDIDILIANLNEESKDYFDKTIKMRNFIFEQYQKNIHNHLEELYKNMKN